MKRLDSHVAGARPRGHQEDHHKNHDADKRREEQKIEEDRDTTSKDASDNLHKNRKMSPPNKLEV